jgi:hypothetical protein
MRKFLLVLGVSLLICGSAFAQYRTVFNTPILNLNGWEINKPNGQVLFINTSSALTTNLISTTAYIDWIQVSNVDTIAHAITFWDSDLTISVSTATFGQFGYHLWQQYSNPTGSVGALVRIGLTTSTTAVKYPLLQSQQIQP